MPFRSTETQRDRTLQHPQLLQKEGQISPQHSFVVCADTQFGMTTGNIDWEKEMEYSRQAIERMNAMDPKPLYCCVCGDLVDMDASMFVTRGFTKEQCDDIKNRQNRDFQKVWSKLDARIALVCVCGNHDVGNRPNQASIELFKNYFGDDYLAFWANGTYNIVLNSNLFSDPSDAQNLYKDQLEWLKGRLKYAKENKATCIFVFGHHPWFIYDEEEEKEDMKGSSPMPDDAPEEWKQQLSEGVPDSYFPIPKERRSVALELFREYGVDACFSGHFHQNMVSKTRWGMEMIITSSLSMTFESSSRPKNFTEPNGRGIRIVRVRTNEIGQTIFEHKFESL